MSDQAPTSEPMAPPTDKTKRKQVYLGEQPGSPQVEEQPPLKKTKKAKHPDQNSKKKDPAQESIPRVFQSSEDSDADFTGFPASAKKQDPRSAATPSSLDAATLLSSEVIQQVKEGLIEAVLAELTQRAQVGPPPLKSRRNSNLRLPVPRPSHQSSYIRDDEELDPEEGEIASDQDELELQGDLSEDEWGEDNIKEDVPTQRLFQVVDFEQLLKIAKLALDLKDAKADDQPSTSKTAILLREAQIPAPCIPVPKAFRAVAEQECEKPANSRRFTGQANRLYTLESSFMKFLKTPQVDSPVANLVSKAVLPKVEGSQLKDASDRQLDLALRRSFEATSLAIRASFSASLFARASMVWLDEILEEPTMDPDRLRKAILRMHKTAAYVSDATLDAAQFLARSLAAGTVARRSLWLKHWDVDQASRNNLAHKPFKGELLFGEEALKEVLVDPKEKKKPCLVTADRESGRPFRRFTTSTRTTRPFRSFRSTFPNREQRYNRFGRTKPPPRQQQFHNNKPFYQAGRGRGGFRRSRQY